MDRVLAIRALGLFVPLAAFVALWMLRRPAMRSRAGILLACVWNLEALALLQPLAERAGWWRFEAEGAKFAGMPVELYLGWAVLWGGVAPLALARIPVAVAALVALLADVVLMPQLAPVLRLSDTWLWGELVFVGVAFVPGMLLARWTSEGRFLGRRVAMQVVLFSGMMLGLLPAVIMANAGGDWSAPLARPAWLNGLLLQALAVPGVLGLSAVMEFARRGRGTPLPYDPPQKLVTSGPYAYLANPMQTAAVLLMAGWGLFLENIWIAAAGVIAHTYSAGLAAWDESEDMQARFGEAWRDYRVQVRRWIPRWRPFVSETARLYVAETCDVCSPVRRWVEARRPVGLTVVAAEQHPTRALRRITYAPASGDVEEEGVAALARALEHVNLAYAFVGWTMRLPVVRAGLQLLVDASGGEARELTTNAGERRQA